MAKITLSLGDKFLREIPIVKERVTIGRGPKNDIVLDDRAISGEHAVIVTLNHDSYLEDLNSTNGTQVNGQPVKKHYLQDGDCIELAQYRMRYFIVPNFGSVDLGRGASSDKQVDGHVVPAKVLVLNGVRAGIEIVLSNAITTIGRQDVHTAVILRRPNGYYLAHIDGNTFPSLNGTLIGALPEKLNNNDVIELSGDRVQFFGD